MSFWPGLMPSLAQLASSFSMPPLTMIFCRSGATPAPKRIIRRATVAYTGQVTCWEGLQVDSC